MKEIKIMARADFACGVSRWIFLPFLLPLLLLLLFFPFSLSLSFAVRVCAPLRARAYISIDQLSSSSAGPSSRLSFGFAFPLGVYGRVCILGSSVTPRREGRGGMTPFLVLAPSSLGGFEPLSLSLSRSLSLRPAASSAPSSAVSLPFVSRRRRTTQSLAVSLVLSLSHSLFLSRLVHLSRRTRAFLLA